MDMNGYEGILGVSVDAYPYSCSELECPCEGDQFSLLCRYSSWQWVGLNDSPESPPHTWQNVCHPGQSLLPSVTHLTSGWPIG
jgi:hypothetical protein